MAAELYPCPHCNVQILSGSIVCPSCKKKIELCSNCGFFIYLDSPNCRRCGVFVAKEPRISARTWIEGSGMVGDVHTLKFHIENFGNIPTEIKIKVECPKGIEPEKFEETISELYPKKPILKSYQFQATAPGEYILEKFNFIYYKSSKEEEKLELKPIKFAVYGRPIVQLSVEPESNEVKLGEVADFFIKLRNTGSAPALFVKLETAYPTSIILAETNIILPELKPGEERVALIKVRPMFTGPHVCRARCIYASPPMGPIAPATFESTIVTYNVVAEYTERIERKKSPRDWR